MQNRIRRPPDLIRRPFFLVIDAVVRCFLRDMDIVRMRFLQGRCGDLDELRGGLEGLDVLRAADVPAELAHAEAVLETRALRLAGRDAEADARWRRYIESRKGADRKWIA